MVCISAIATHEAPSVERMGLRRALLTRRANLGDCADARSVIHHMLSPAEMRYPVCVVPLPRRVRGQASAADLGVMVAQQALSRAAALKAQDVGGLIYCHATPDERSSDSTAGRLQHVLGLPNACAFSLSQAHNTALLIALDLAAGLVEGPESAGAVLLVASDKLVFGTPPHAARRMAWSDTAAAAVVTRQASAGWRLVHVTPRHFDTPLRAHEPWPPAATEAFAHFGAEAIRACLAEAALDPGRLAAVASASANAALAGQVHERAGLGGLPVCAARGARAARASCADLLIRLAELERSVPAGQHVLAWSQGDNGEFACAILTRIG
jgi:3-oxoacyl-[acyl-carrier-protein] synthase III